MQQIYYTKLSKKKKYTEKLLAVNKQITSRKHF